MNKKEIRKKYKDLRSLISTEELEEKSLAIANLLLKLAIWQKNYYHLFLSIEKQKEINTACILQILAGKDKEIVISKSDFETGKMIHFLLTDNTKIKLNDYGIPEPIDGLEVPTSKIDVVFVPLLAFDKNGHRVGYGKGFYDRFLSECKPETIKVGLSFFAPETAIADFDERDIRLNYCVTPEEIYSF
ncbi:5-formyltetrahydrofolate cyclo-ligase [Flavobacterium orientale]|uniref:5-formyltetrahydrofolate cyclo-ligase n=1 Tax=Flavobacterium orientale TaxID=1756020 RepID=A0A916XYE8_9FLAO|nr:5-formyltetrahydrofolate cyclo-ligase [Flavobacterium orientale]GGD21564.1 5-formyltetrahydrofolate cyclo-ligase [Flavobacterium orientale]